MEILSKSVLSNEYRSVKNVNVKKQISNNLHPYHIFKTLMWRKKIHRFISHYFIQIKGNKRQNTQQY